MKLACKKSLGRKKLERHRQEHKLEHRQPLERHKQEHKLDRKQLERHSQDRC